MLWLNKKELGRDIITCNMIVLADSKLKILEELKSELMDSSKYVLSRSDVVYSFDKCLFEINDGKERIENQFIGYKDDDKIYVRRYYDNLRKYSLEILSQINLPRDIQMDANINLLMLLNNDLNQINMAEGLLRKLYREDKDEIRYIMSNLWQDFYFFAKEVLDVIELDEISRYDLEDLRKIKNLCIKNNIQDNFSNILEYTDVANNNDRVLRLAKDINGKEKYWK